MANNPPQEAITKLKALFGKYRVQAKVTTDHSRKLFNAENHKNATWLYDIIYHPGFSSGERADLIAQLGKMSHFALEFNDGRLKYIFTELRYKPPQNRPLSQGGKPSGAAKKSYEKKVLKKQEDQGMEFIGAPKVVKEIAGVKIERGIPIPSNHWGKWSQIVGAMEIGDSVLIKAKTSPMWSMRKSAERLKIKLLCRKVDEGFRIWRVAEKDIKK